ncbi:uncharacterized protein LY89DRAFT_702272 [Mollisia scopiformis]|uniref:Uncharacterized protein n=1 Tax=Mollisia scopiformis TaxID=149040 RepID=A0A132B7L3_MOLSC|nr:uncharacterized protein LY89DRAFT_702272 [Mollisia scopiformis]KUJ07874.1 hypothetical protein LY89DRAFT_702272 [Mollisia scopiformis]
MFTSTVLSLFSAASLVAAAVIPDLTLARRNLTENEVIVWGSNGRVEVMNKSEFALLASESSQSFNLTSSTPVLLNNTAFNHSLSSRALSSRSCSSDSYFTMNPASTFLNWDVPMSSVLHATSPSTSVSVTEGYTISNTIQIGVSSTLTIVESFLSTTFSINYSESWSSSYSAAYTFAIPEGKYGVVVSNSMTTRHSGYVDVGCIGSTERTYFQADSYNSKAYGGLSWVDGTISLCTGDTYPVPMCLGGGTLS